MKSVVETLNPTRVRLVVEVPFEELKSSLDSAYRRIAEQVVVPGFRKGKVPPRVIDQRFGREVVLEEAVSHALPTLYGQAVEANELQPMGKPKVDVGRITDGEEVTFTAEVDVRPTVELPEWEGLSIEVADGEVSDQEVGEQVDGLRARFGTLVGVDRPAADGDFVVIDLVARQDGEPVADGEAKAVSYQVGSDSMVDGLDEAVTGLSAGESATFTTMLLGDHEGEEVECEVTVSAVKVQELPPLDDDFAQMASEFDTLDELRADLRGRLERSKRVEQAMTARDQVLDKLLERVGDVPLPEGVISAELDEHFADGHGDDEHRGSYEEGLRHDLLVQFVLDEIVKSEELSVSQEELTSYLLQQAARSGVDPNELAQQYVQTGNLPALVAEVARGKALVLVVERAHVVDASGRPVPLDRLREDGTLASESTDVAAEAGSVDAGGDAEAEPAPSEQELPAEQEPAAGR